MATGKGRAVLGHLRTLFNVGAIRELSDGQLLERFATEPGEAAELAFAALVERHGPMVLRVCRGVLTDPHDAQDAFQATFLVLVRRARALWVHDSLGPWLHQVACRTAMCARRAAARRRRHERSAAATTRERPMQPPGELEWAIHEEIDRLPESFRAAVVLCDLGGRTQEQAARHLGWPIGTVKSRLSRGRERLRERLQRRGLGPDASLVALAARFDASAPAVPAALVHATIAASMQMAAGRSLLEGPAGTLARGVFKSMIITRCLKAAAFVLVAGATAFGVDSARGTDSAVGQLPAQAALALAQAKAERPPTDSVPAATNKDEGEGKSADGVKVMRAEPRTETFSAGERGVVGPASSNDVFCRVEAGATIVSLLPEGTKVKKGDVVGKLDSAALQDQRTNQVIATEGARAAYQNATLAREEAEVNRVEYESGIFKHESESLLRQVAAAESAIKRARARLERARQAQRRLTATQNLPRGAATTPADLVAELDVNDRVDEAEQAVDRETLALDDAKSKQDLLTRFTKGKTLKQLQAEIDKARSNEMTRKLAWQIEHKKLTRLEAQIQECTLVAPSEGSIVHARVLDGAGGETGPIEEGMSVRQRQKLFSVIDLDGPLRVTVKVPESSVPSVRRGRSIALSVDAFPDRALTGLVEEVSPLPDPLASKTGKRVYTTHILVENTPPGIRPGMTAQAAIPFAELKDVISVPRDAVIFIDRDAEHYLLVRGAAGGFEIRKVKLGAGDMKRLQVKEGLRAGEEVVVNPFAVMSLGQIRKKLGM